MQFGTLGRNASEPSRITSECVDIRRFPDKELHGALLTSFQNHANLDQRAWVHACSHLAAQLDRLRLRWEEGCGCSTLKGSRVLEIPVSSEELNARAGVSHDRLATTDGDHTAGKLVVVVIHRAHRLCRTIEGGGDKPIGILTGHTKHEVSVEVELKFLLRCLMICEGRCVPLHSILRRPRQG